MFLLGTVIATRAARRIWRCVQASRWPTTTATLLVTEDQDISGPEDANHLIRVRYIYQVESASYEGNTLHPCYSGGSRFGKAHAELLALLQTGQRYQVHYDPDRPDQSTLSAGFHLRSIFLLLFGLELMLFATGILTKFARGSTWGTGLLLLFGVNFAMMLLVLLMDYDRFTSRIRRIPS